MKKRIALFALAALAAFGAQAVGGKGDIRSVEAVHDLSLGYTYPNNVTPHKVGETFFILVRLLDEEFRDTTTHE